MYLKLNSWILILSLVLFKQVCDTTEVTSSTQETTQNTSPLQTGTSPPAIETTGNPSTVETTVNPSSTKSTVSPFPVETTANPFPVNKYTVSDRNGTVCIVIVAEITFHIQYNATGDVKKIGNITIPEDYTTTGDCSAQNNEQIITIKFFNETWNLSITIAYEKETAAVSTVKEDKQTPYSWKDISFTYIVDETMFPDVLPEYIGSKVMEDVWYVSGVFETYGKSYKCEETKKVNMSNGLEMDVSQLQYRAFGTTNNDTFSNTDVTDCATSPNNDFDKTPAIVIGAVCGGLVVICLVVYILFRRREHNNYQPM